jgi:hypothetical protein
LDAIKQRMGCSQSPDNAGSGPFINKETKDNTMSSYYCLALNNGAVPTPGVNPWNERQAAPTQRAVLVTLKEEDAQDHDSGRQWPQRKAQP